jgi:hypothetical protein
MTTYSPSAPSTPSEFDLFVVEVVNDCVLSLKHGVNYTSKTMVPPVVWRSLDDGEQRKFGRVLSNLVSRELLPLVRTSPPYKMPVTYQRI